MMLLFIFLQELFCCDWYIFFRILYVVVFFIDVYRNNAKQIYKP